ncbi:MAG: BrnT family toxin [Coriobacteriia bacterium]|nr:BrnT family toxin [Coriobacteriia bacterium]MCL2749620.1 BrnT family toxin [Coriobacteriia bacterium]
MKEIQFIWDEQKSLANITKHQVTFEEAKTVFSDANARVIADPDYSDDEDRFIILGISNKLRLLVVCHCYRESDEVIRIISARKATKNEVRSYGK